MAKNIFDDVEFMRMMIKDIMTKTGYDVAGEDEKQIFITDPRGDGLKNTLEESGYHVGSVYTIN